MRRLITATAIVAFGLAGTSACATKGYVRNQVGQVSSKVDTLSTSLEETQERTKKNEAKIAEVEQNAQTGIQGANQAASTADGKAVAADAKATEAGAAARTAAERADAVDKSTKRVIYEVVLSEDSGNFKFGQAKLDDDSKAKIDELVAKILADPKGAYFEIEGHTDNVGSPDGNQRLGMQRAEAVKAYLYDQHKIPLHKMNVISYGEAKPVEKNNTSKGRAMNRRVVLRVLA
ncbi:MAG TPA: OmpA family protein [Vicinamibacterales bacterium]|nr:OmpA family protein [Vicinamibacterales bacterium]